MQIAAFQGLSRSWRELPRIVRLIIANCAAGALLGACVATLILVFDVQGIRQLITGTGDQFTAGVLLFAGMMITFGSLYAGGAIMMDRGE